MLLENRPGLVENVCWKFEGNHLKRFLKKGNQYAKKEDNFNHIKFPVKTVKGKKPIKMKPEQEQRQQIEKSNKIWWILNNIDNHFECQWSKFSTN